MIDLHLNADIRTFPEHEAKQKIDNINLVAEFFCNQNSFDESMYCSENALSMAISINYIKGIAAAKQNLGEIHYRKHEFREAMLNFSEAIKLFIQINERSNEGKTYIHLAVSHRHLDDYTTMIELCFKALNIFRETNDEYNEGFILNIIGNYYLEVREYDLSIEYYSMALKIQRKQKIITQIILVIFNTGLAYYNLAEINPVPLEKSFLYEKSLKYYNEAQNFNLKFNKDIFLKYRISRNIAMTYGYQEKFDGAEKIFHDCLEHFTKIEDKIEICESLTDLGDLYTRMKKYDEAEKKLRDAEKLADELESKRLQRGVAWKFVDFFRAKNDFNKALIYFRRYAVIEFERKRTLVENNIRKLNIMHTVDITKKETEILSEKNEQLKTLNEKLVKLNNEKNYFLNLAANDLKLPLEKISSKINSIRSYKEIEKINSLKEILDESSHMQKIISELLTINEIETTG